LWKEGKIMLIGAPKEIKNREYRVGLTPVAARELTMRGHEVLIESKAGFAIGFDDDDYEAAGAHIVSEAAEIYGRAELIVKVKEPQPSEIAMMRAGQVLFAYLHLAASAEQARGLMEAGVVAIAYETVTDNEGRLPLLAPMSEVAGRMAAQAGARCLEMESGGAGILLGGVPAVEAGRVVVLGGGMAGANAARMAMGLGAMVTVLDISLPRLSELDMMLGGGLNTVYSTRRSIEKYVREADLVIGAALAPGARAPVLVSEELVREMKRGAAIVDIAIDQGGVIATSRPTTHDEPTFIRHGVVHYCVTNMPGAVARTSTFALGNATLPYVIAIADKGWARALKDDANLANGLNVRDGELVHAAVRDALEDLP
jgi:alanine dehydrogenase